MFKKFFDELMNAKTVDELAYILYRNDESGYGVDIAFQKEKISWADHERLFNLELKLELALTK